MAAMAAPSSASASLRRHGNRSLLSLAAAPSNRRLPCLLAGLRRERSASQIRAKEGGSVAGPAAVSVCSFTMSQFNFGTPGAPGSSSSAGGGFTFGTPKTAPSSGAPPGGFSFSSSAASGATGAGGGFSFGTPAATTGAQPAGLFSFAPAATSSSTPAQTSGFSFGTSAAPPPAAAPAGSIFALGGNAPKLNLGTTQAPGIMGGFGLSSSSGGGLASSIPSSAAAAQPAAPSGFVFGSSASSQAATTGGGGGGGGGFSFGSAGTTQAAAAAAPGFSLGSAGNAVQPASAPGLTFGLASASSAAPIATASQPATVFSLGTQSTGSGFGLLTSSAAPASSTGSIAQAPTLSFGAKLGGTTPASTATATTTSNPLIGGASVPTLFASIAASSQAATTSAPISLLLGTTSTGTTAPTLDLGFGLKAPGTTTAATAPSITSTASAPSTGFMLNLKSMAPTTTVASTSTVATTTVAAPPVMTYAQLESLINKWSLELEDQEKHFLQQATQVNAWDRTLIENGEKITSLHREVEKVKLDQKRLDQELDFILSQQKELEDLLVPLEESVKEQSGTIYLQHADEEREKTYKLAENIDAQLKRMAQDLKDIIEHLNTSGGPADTSDPLQQICKILNAHMDSLQWIDQNSALLQRKVEEVSKVCDGRRKEQERSFRITFD
ncbi:nucleoporin-62 C-terminal-like protein isoform X1 [Anolis carolinensis]|uniref:nucleoporin-62 C-terminal-like protein isoform X1 n=2 Tax=Anolis carolinensis TaxID=28377 RepID=UPI002F2B18D5